MGKLIGKNFKYEDEIEFYETVDFWADFLLNSGVTFFELKLYFNNSADNLNIDKTVDFMDVRLYLNKFNTVLSEIYFVDSNFGSFGIVHKNNKNILYMHCILGFKIKVPYITVLHKK